MPRKKDVEWNVGEESTFDGAKLAVLMDLRDELKKLNALMHCSNVIKGFRALQRLDKRLAKKVPLR